VTWQFSICKCFSFLKVFLKYHWLASYLNVPFGDPVANLPRSKIIWMAKIVVDSYSKEPKVLATGREYGDAWIYCKLCQQFLTAACCPKRDFYTHPIHPPPANLHYWNICTSHCDNLFWMSRFCGWHSYIFTEKIAIIHTFSGFGTLSELLSHFLGGMLLSWNQSKSDLVI